MYRNKQTFLNFILIFIIICIIYYCTYKVSTIPEQYDILYTNNIKHVVDISAFFIEVQTVSACVQYCYC